MNNPEKREKGIKELAGITFSYYFIDKGGGYRSPGGWREHILRIPKSFEPDSWTASRTAQLYMNLMSMKEDSEWRGTEHDFEVSELYDCESDWEIILEDLGS